MGERNSSFCGDLIALRTESLNLSGRPSAWIQMWVSSRSFTVSFFAAS